MGAITAMLSPKLRKMAMANGNGKWQWHFDNDNFRKVTRGMPLYVPHRPFGIVGANGDPLKTGRATKTACGPGPVEIFGRPWIYP
jgi:hypothetical protein